MNSIQQVLAELGRIEPRLVQFAAVAPADTFDICAEVLATHASELERANAIMLACLVDSSRGLGLIEKGLKDASDLVRIAATRSLEIIPSAEIKLRTSIVRMALLDSDAGVRKFALRVVKQHAISELRPEIERMRQHDPAPYVQKMATEIQIGE